MCGKKWFLPKDFVNKNQIEKLTGVYFPYWYIDTQKDAKMTALGKKIRTWRSGNKRYTETSTYRLHRSGNLVIKNVFERALKNESREMLQSVHPFDLSQAHDFSMSYLSGFQAEKRDIEIPEIKDAVEQRIQGYCKELLQGTMDGYTGIVCENYSDRTDLESFNYTLLPVWIMTYKYKGDILPFAINGQTGKVCGKLPVDNKKLFLVSLLLGLIIFVIAFLGGYLLL